MFPSVPSPREWPAHKSSQQAGTLGSFLPHVPPSALSLNLSLIATPYPPSSPLFLPRPVIPCRDGSKGLLTDFLPLPTRPPIHLPWLAMLAVNLIKPCPMRSLLNIPQNPLSLPVRQKVETQRHGSVTPSLCRLSPCPQPDAVAATTCWCTAMLKWSSSLNTPLPSAAVQAVYCSLLFLSLLSAQCCSLRFIFT